MSFMYKEDYGFAEEPLQINPAPRFLYMTPTLGAAMFCVMAGIKNRKRITVASGDAGTGKTTLIDALLKELGDKIKTTVERCSRILTGAWRAAVR